MFIPLFEMSRTQEVIEAEIQAMKDAHPDWIMNSVDKGLIKSL